MQQQGHQAGSSGHHPGTVRLHCGRSHRAAGPRPAEKPFPALLRLLIPADRWREVGAEHPFCAQCRGFVDIVPERYDRATLEDVIAAVPPEVIGTGVLVGTPEQVTARLQQFGDAGLRHVVLGPLSAFIAVPDFVYAGWAVRRIARSLRTG